jgi:hypothetical protein
MPDVEELIAEKRRVRIQTLIDEITRVQIALEARDAVIAQARKMIPESAPELLDYGYGIDAAELLAILAQSPTDALDAVKAEVWDAGRDCLRWNGEAWEVDEQVNPYRANPTEKENGDA